MGLPFKINIPRPVVILLAVFIVAFGVYKIGQIAGSNKTQVAWDASDKKREAQIKSLQTDLNIAETANRISSNRISDELAETKTNYLKLVDELQRDRAQRLLDSKNREGIYQRLAQGGSTQQERLAGYAARLDGSLTEGRSLVEELRLTVKQRERELNLLGDQIISDRKLISSAQSPTQPERK